MSTWNYRVLATKTDEGIYLQVHEVYYTNGVPDGYTEKPITIESDTLKGIRWQISKIKKCLGEPILWAGDKFPQEYKEDE